MELFNKFIEFSKKSIQLDGWSQSEGLEGYAKTLEHETEELKDALKKKDTKNLKNELGDILWIWTHMCLFAEQDGLFTMEEIMQHNMQKMKRRKPYLAEGRKVSREEALELWNTEKEREKNGGN